MTSKSLLWPPEAEYHTTLTRITLAALVVAVVFGGAWIVGRSERAVYLGVAPGYAGADVVHLRTEPPATYIASRGARTSHLVVGCRYDFNYDPQFGRRRGHERMPERRLRYAKLVDCPAK